MQLVQVFMDLHSAVKFIDLISSTNPQILTRLGKFVQKSLSLRNERRGPNVDQ